MERKGKERRLERKEKHSGGFAFLFASLLFSSVVVSNESLQQLF